MAAIAGIEASKMLNSSCSATAYTTKTTGFLIRLNSTVSVEATEGTQIASGNGYTTNGQTSTAPFASTSTAGSAVTIPNTAILTWTCTLGGGWSIAGPDLTDGAFVWTWYGAFTGQPIAVANGNTFQVAVNAVSVSLL
jgi:hypothetical protein